jgi:hypothetical protein
LEQNTQHLLGRAGNPLRKSLDLHFQGSLLLELPAFSAGSSPRFHHFGKLNCFPSISPS